ncbi:MAG: sigma-70 family RNA polymerase sigma factor [Pseudomonadota bacterium]
MAVQTQHAPSRDAVAQTRAFREELVAILPHLRAYARFLSKNRDLADDIVQDTVVQILRSEEHYRPMGHFKAWAFTILRNRFYGQWRAADRRTVPLEEQDRESLATQANGQEGAVAFRDFHKAFWALSENHREVLVLIGRSGLSYEEVAKVCGCEIGTIKSRLSRARDALRGRLDA